MVSTSVDLSCGGLPPVPPPPPDELLQAAASNEDKLKRATRVDRAIVRMAVLAKGSLQSTWRTSCEATSLVGSRSCECGRKAGPGSTGISARCRQFRPGETAGREG